MNQSIKKEEKAGLLQRRCMCPRRILLHLWRSSSKHLLIKIVSRELRLDEIGEPIVNENFAQSSMQKVEARVVANKDKAKSGKLDSKYFQQKWSFHVRPRHNGTNFNALVVRNSSKMPRAA